MNRLTQHACHPEHSEGPLKLLQAPHLREIHALGWFVRSLAALGMTCFNAPTSFMGAI